MTKIAYCSDLHLEFLNTDFNCNLPDADILILPGDICLGVFLEDRYVERSEFTKNFLKRISDKYEHIIWIPGNHEYYHNNISKCNAEIKKYIECNHLRITYNDCGIYYLHDIKIVYGTLWTDIRRADPFAIDAAARMNDYSCIWTDSNQLSYTDTIGIHNIHKEHISKESKNYMGKIVVATHHAPDTSILTRKIDDLSFSFACTDMIDIILDNTEKIKYWLFGHTHDTPGVTTIGDTKFISNCCGYDGHDNFVIRTIEL